MLLLVAITIKFITLNIAHLLRICYVPSSNPCQKNGWPL